MAPSGSNAFRMIRAHKILKRRDWDHHASSDLPKGQFLARKQSIDRPDAEGDDLRGLFAANE